MKLSTKDQIKICEVLLVLRTPSDYAHERDHYRVFESNAKRVCACAEAREVDYTLFSRNRKQNSLEMAIFLSSER